MPDVTSYCTTEAVCAELGIVDGGDDLAIGLAADAASREIDNLCGRRFWRNATVEERTFYPQDLYCLELKPDGIADITDLVVKLDVDSSGSFETTLTLNTDFVLLPQNAAVMFPAEPFTTILLTGTYTLPRPAYNRPTVQVTAHWGWPEVPAAIEKAALVQAVHLFKSRDAQTGALFFAGGDAVGALRVSGLHPIARTLIDPYRRGVMFA